MSGCGSFSQRVLEVVDEWALLRSRGDATDATLVDAALRRGLAPDDAARLLVEFTAAEAEARPGRREVRP